MRPMGSCLAVVLSALVASTAFATELRAGVELEVTNISNEDAIAAVVKAVNGKEILPRPAYPKGRVPNATLTGAVRDSKGRIWRIEHHPISSSSRGTAEVVSPKLAKGEISLVEALAQELKARGGISDRRMGGHIHMGYANGGRLSLAKINNLTRFVALNEALLSKAFVQFAGRKASASQMTPAFRSDVLSHPFKSWDAVKLSYYGSAAAAPKGRFGQRYDASRYKGFNLHNIFLNDRPNSIEWRYPDGSLKKSALRKNWMIAFGLMEKGTAVAKPPTLRSVKGLFRHLGVGDREYRAYRSQARQNAQTGRRVPRGA